MNVGAWLKGHKPEAALGVGGIVVAIALYMRSKSNAAANSTNAAVTPYPVSTANTTGTDVYNGLEDQINQLQGALATLTAQSSQPPAQATPAPPPTAPPPPPGTSFAMEGPNFVGRGPQGAYVGISDPSQAAAYTAQGTTLDTYAPALGFEPLAANEPGTIPGEFLQISTQPFGGVTPK